MNTKIITGANPGIISALGTKPVADIDKIIEQISPFATSFRAKKAKFYVIIQAIKEPVIYSIREALR